MSYVYTINQSQSGGGTTISGAVRQFTGTGRIGVSESIAPATTNELVAFAAARAIIKCIAIKATGPLTIKTNSSGSPVDTITLAANQAKFWGNDESTTVCFFTADVTALYVTNAGAAAVTFTLEALVDATP